MPEPQKHTDRPTKPIVLRTAPADEYPPACKGVRSPRRGKTLTKNEGWAVAVTIGSMVICGSGMAWSLYYL
jgi:hypothetical protein